MEDPGHVSFYPHAGAEDTSDGQDRVMSRATYDLQVRHSTLRACGLPGFVPYVYFEH